MLIYGVFLHILTLNSLTSSLFISERKRKKIIRKRKQTFETHDIEKFWSKVTEIRFQDWISTFLPDLVSTFNVKIVKPLPRPFNILLSNLTSRPNLYFIVDSASYSFIAKFRFLVLYYCLHGRRGGNIKGSSWQSGKNWESFFPFFLFRFSVHSLIFEWNIVPVICKDELWC